MDNKKKKIKISYDDTEYVLEFTPDSLKQMERNGFNFTKMNDYILTAPEELFYGAFITNHKRVPQAKRKEIWDSLCNQNENGEYLTDVIGDMISEAITELNTHQGNVAWSVER